MLTQKTFHPRLKQIVLHALPELAVATFVLVVAFFGQGFWIPALIIGAYCAYMVTQRSLSRVTISDQWVEVKVFRTKRLNWTDVVEISEEGLTGIPRLLPGLRGFFIRGLSSGRRIRLTVEKFGFERSEWDEIQQQIRKKAASVAPGTSKRQSLRA